MYNLCEQKNAKNVIFVIKWVLYFWGRKSSFFFCEHNSYNSFSFKIDQLLEIEIVKFYREKTHIAIVLHSKNRYYFMQDTHLMKYFGGRPYKRQNRIICRILDIINPNRQAFDPIVFLLTNMCCVGPYIFLSTFFFPRCTPHTGMRWVLLLSYINVQWRICKLYTSMERKLKYAIFIRIITRK